MQIQSQLHVRVETNSHGSARGVYGDEHFKYDKVYHNSRKCRYLPDKSSLTQREVRSQLRRPSFISKNYCRNPMALCHLIFPVALAAMPLSDTTCVCQAGPSLYPPQNAHSSRLEILRPVSSVFQKRMSYQHRHVS